VFPRPTVTADQDKSEGTRSAFRACARLRTQYRAPWYIPNNILFNLCVRSACTSSAFHRCQEACYRTQAAKTGRLEQAENSRQDRQRLKSDLSSLRRYIPPGELLASQRHPRVGSQGTGVLSLPFCSRLARVYSILAHLLLRILPLDQMLYSP
jgi:hypothetical protein